MNNEPRTKTLSVFCDGGARGNPGPAASAFVVKDSSEKILHEQGFYLGIATNNQAEYQAVIEALKWVSVLSPQPSALNFYLDSQLVVNQLNGNYKVKDSELKVKFTEIKKLLDQLGQLEIRNFVYVPRTQNSRADFVVNQTLDNHR